MRTHIITSGKPVEVIAEEFSITGVSHRFIVHNTLPCDIGLRLAFVATHLETSQVIGDGDTIDEAIANGTRRWLAAAPEMIEDRLAERRKWVAARNKELCEASKAIGNAS